MRDVWLSLLLMAVFQACGGAVCADVRLTEVMCDPAGSELTDEFIEVQNIGPLPVDMTGWRVGEGAVTEALIAVGSASLASGQFSLLLDPDCELGVGAYAPLPGDAILFLLDGGTFGRSGLSNTQAETIVLLNAQGDTIDTHTYSIGNDEGFSEERTRGIEDLWSATLWRGGTPGSINSISPKEMDLEVTADVTLVPYGHEPLVALTLHNRGRQAAGGDLILSLEGAEVDRVRIPEIAPGSADSITAVGAAYPGRMLFYEARVVSPGDQDATNDRVSVRVVYGVIPGGVVLSELMVAPSAGPEWIEVVNRSGVEVDLFGWGFWDSSGKRGHVRTPSLLQDGARAVLSKGEVNEVEAVQVEPWPVLNDGGDSVTLFDGTGSETDRRIYESSRPGRSLERIDLSAPGDGSNWLSSTAPFGATPGGPNAVAFAPDGSLHVEARPSPFSESSQVTVETGVRRARLVLRVFDRVGRLRRVLVQGAEVGSRFVTTWDGRDDRGVRVKPGPHILDVEAVSDGQIVRARTTVAYSRGLGKRP